MSKALVDKLLQEAYTVANDRWARSGIDKSKQEVRVSRANLKNAFKDAFNDTHRKEFKELPHPFLTIEGKIDETPFNLAADAAFESLKTYLGKSRQASLVSESSQQIIFSMPRTFKTPVTNLKNAGVDSLNKSLASLGRDKLSKSQTLDIAKGLERLHKDITVGTGRLFYTLNTFKEDPVGNKFLQSEQYKSLVDKYGDVFLDYKIIDNSKGKPEIRALQTVGIYLAPKSKNFAGSESKDWKNIRPELEKALTKWLASKDMANQEGSKSLKDHAIDKAEYYVLKSLLSSKKVKGKLPKKPKSANRKPQTVQKKASNKPKNTKTVKAKPYKSPKQSIASMSSIIGVINQQLPKTVADNMGSPRLNYRTGRFASSVRVTEVVSTAQGYPSIGYTYQKYPYQTFEPGYRQGSVERDPRKLIDASIREIALQFAIGRFYTRRV